MLLLYVVIGNTYVVIGITCLVMGIIEYVLLCIPVWLVGSSHRETSGANVSLKNVASRCTPDVVPIYGCVSA